MKTITSIQNPEIKNVQKLHTKKGRTEQNKFIAQGIRVCTTLIESGLTPVAVYSTRDYLEDLEKLVPETAITFIDDNVLKKISTAKTPAGVVCVFDIPEKPSLPLTRGLVLANITDPGNMGTLIRTATAMNIKTIVIVDGCSPWNPKVIQASAGSIGMVNIFELSWDELVQQKKDLQLCALVVQGGKKPQDVNFDNTLLVVGNEAHGIPHDWLKDCEQKLTLPMPGETESLNAAVAGSLALYTMIKS